MKTLISDRLAVLKFIVITAIIIIGMVLPLGTAFAKDKANRVTSATKGSVIEITVQFPAPVITKTEDGYDHIEMSGIPSLGNTGEPVLPVKGVNVLIPAGKDVKSSELILGEKVTLPGKYNIEPAQQPIPLSYEGKVEKTLPKDEIYKSNKAYPKDKKEKVTTQKMRGYRVEVFKLCPIEYIPQEGTLSYYKSMTLKITLEKKAKPKKAGLEKEPKLRKLRKDKEMLERFIANTQDIQSYDTEPEEPAGGGVQTTGEAGGGVLGFVNPAESYQYVIITNENLKNAPGPYNFQAFCAEKNARGVTTNIVTTEWIYANYDGTRPDGGADLATKIRNFIIDAYNNWETEYILLGGDATGNPSNTEIIAVRKLRDTFYGGEDIPSDIYYCCLDGTMDFDRDGAYGEPNDGEGGGEIDLLAEVYVGRAPVVTQVELANFVRKTMTYKSTNSAYILNTHMVGEHLGFGGPAEYATDSMEEIRLGSNAHGYTTAGFATLDYLKLNTLYDAPGDSWPKNELIGIINNGVHIINHLGHANVTYNMKMSNSDADAFTNTDYFFGYSQGCLPGAFEQDCIVEHFVKNATGAFAFIGNSRYGWGMRNSTAGASQYYARQFWDAVFGETLLNLGRANEDSKEDNIWCIAYSAHRWCYLELNLFGDPELCFRLASSDGIVWLDDTRYSTSANVKIFLVDSDLNTNPSGQDTVIVNMTSAREVTPEPVVLTETDLNNSYFAGAITLELGEPEQDSVLQVNESDEITVTYNEASPAETNTCSANVDGKAPVIVSGPLVSTYITIGDRGATITWKTDEESNTTVHYGTTPALGLVKSDPGLVKDHSIKLSGLQADTVYYFAVRSTDYVGNTVYDNNSGACYQFTILAPDIQATPAVLSLNSYEYADIFAETLTIANTEAGSADLLFQIQNSAVSWLSISPLAGTVPAGSSVDIQLTINPRALAAGVYDTQISVNHNGSGACPVLIPVQLTLNSAAALRLDSYAVIDDWSGRDYMGNGNGMLNPGEIVELKASIKNIGHLAASGVSATLSLKNSDPYVAISDDSVMAGYIAAQGVVTPTDTFLLEVADDIPLRHQVTFVLEMRDAGGKVWHEELTLKVDLGMVDVKSVPVRLDVGDPAGASPSYSPDICCDDKGHIYVAWEDSRNDFARNIYYNYSHDYGLTWRTSDKRLDTDASYSMGPSIVCDNNGHVYVVSSATHSGSNTYNVYLNYSHDYGVSWLTDSGVGEKVIGEGSNPLINCHDNGSVYIAYYSGGFAYSHNYGVTWQTIKPAIGANIKMCSDDNGNIYIAWCDDSNHIFFNYSRDGGATWLAVPILIKSAAVSWNSIKIACDNSGNVYMLWTGYSSNGDTDVFFNHSQDYGATWRPMDIRLDTDEPSAARSDYPALSCDGSGNVYAAWYDDRHGGYDVYFNHSEDFGETWQESDSRINDEHKVVSPDYYHPPRLKCDATGAVYVMFGGWDTNAFYLSYSLDYAASWAEKEVFLDIGQSKVGWVNDMTCDNNGHIFITWEDKRYGGYYDIYFTYANVATTIPNILPLPDQEAESGVLLEFPVKASNRGGTALQLFYDARKLPAEMLANISSASLTSSFDPANGLTTGVFRWTPGPAPSGLYYPITIVAKDPGSGRCTYKNMTINLAPITAIEFIDKKIIDDWSRASYQVDGDGQFNPGERIGLGIRVSNSGQTIAAGLKAGISLVSPDPYITIKRNEIGLPNISPSSSEWSSDNFLIEAAPDTPLHHTVTLAVDIGNSGGNFCREETTLEIMPSAVTPAPPIMNPLTDRHVYEGQLLQFVVTAANESGTKLDMFFDVSELPQAMQNNMRDATFDVVFDEESRQTRGTFSWLVDMDTFGRYYPVAFVARDNLTGRYAFRSIVIDISARADKAMFIDDYNDADVSKNSLGLPIWSGCGPATTFASDVVYLHKYMDWKWNNAARFAYDFKNPGEYGWYASMLWDNAEFLDAANYEYLSFRIKGDVGGEDFRIQLQYGEPAGGGPGPLSEIDSADYFTITDEWQLVNIPLTAFLGLDKTKLRAVAFVWVYENLSVKSGAIYIDNLTLSKGWTKPESTGAVKIDRDARRLLVYGEPYQIKGVCYQPTPIGQKDEYPDSISIYERDFPVLADIGCNTIRTWGIPGMNLMNMAREYGLKIIAGFRMDPGRNYADPVVRQEVRQEFTSMVNAYKDLPALLMWAIGDEYNHYGRDINKLRYYYSLADELAEIAYGIEGEDYHPVILINGHLFNLGLSETACDDLQLSFIDGWGCNIYTDTFNPINWCGDERDFFDLYAEMSSKPLLISAYGADAYFITDPWKLQGHEDESAQADWIYNNTIEIMNAPQHCLGGLLMEYSDEWWRATDYGQPWNSHDAIGHLTSDWGHILPDDYWNGEYFGIVQIAPDGTWSAPDGVDDIKRRAVCDILKDIFTSDRIVEPGESIQGAIDGSPRGSSILVTEGIYGEDIVIKDNDNLALKGRGADSIIKGNISILDSDASIDGFAIEYKQSNFITYQNNVYSDFKISNDAGLAAVDSDVKIRDCIIKPDPDIFGTAKFGKGIQIWNLCGNPDIAPVIENCEISNADTGIYLYSQAFGGAILGEIKNNTLDNNNYGITLRMHKEKPLIKDNEITNSINGIHITYKDGILLTERLNNIINNTFSGDTDDIWCDETGAEPPMLMTCP